MSFNIEAKLLPFESLLSIPLRNGIYKKKEFHGRGAKIVNMGELFAHPRIDSDVEMKRVELDQKETERALLESGDLIFARRSLTAEGAGKCALIADVDEPTTFESSIIRARINTRIAKPEYFYYFFNSVYGKHLLGTILRQVAVSGITGSDLAKLEVPVPSLDQQDFVVSIIRPFDDKIDTNKKINQTLEQIAQAIFKSWFVDFEPTKAKIAALEAGGSEADALVAAMQAISGKTEPELTQLQTNHPDQYAQLRATAELFPSAMQESELGEIPEGWEVDQLASVIDFNPRRTLRKGVDAPYLDMRNVPTSGHLAEEVVNRPMSSGTKFINGDTLLARITPCLENGKTAFVDFLADDQVGWGSTEYIVMRPKNNYPEAIGYFIAREPNFRQIAIQSMTGTSGRQRASAKALEETLWLKYPEKLANAFGKIAGGYLSLARSYGNGSKSLEKIRGALLPKLLSGEIGV